MPLALEQPKSVAGVTLTALFVEFLKVSLMAFGGGLVWAHRAVVVRQRWLSEAEFADILSLCQFLPGPNVVGIAVVVGAKLRGGPGALAALCGFIVFPWGAGFLLGALYLEYAHLTVLRNILGGVSATGAGLLVATGIRLLLPHRRRPAAVLFAALAFGLTAFSKLPLLVVLFTLAPLSIAVAAIGGTRAQ